MPTFGWSEGDLREADDRRETWSQFDDFNNQTFQNKFFDVVFGAIPAVILGFTSFLVGVVFTIQFFDRRSDLDSRFAPLLILCLAVFGINGCIALLMSIIYRRDLGSRSKLYCLVSLYAGIVAFIAATVCIFSMTGFSFDTAVDPVALGFLALGVSVILSTLKQIGLLRNWRRA